MITIGDTLLSECVKLDFTAATPEEAIGKVAALLRQDQRVLNWKEFEKELRAHPPCRVAEVADFGICVPHARTDAVNGMVMSAGRLATPLPFPDCSKPVRYIFCLGIPKTMAADYLRIAGALMRIFTDPETETVLSGTKSREEFVQALEQLEVKV